MTETCTDREPWFQSFDLFVPSCKISILQDVTERETEKVHNLIHKTDISVLLNRSSNKT